MWTSARNCHLYYSYIYVYKYAYTLTFTCIHRSMHACVYAHNPYIVHICLQTYIHTYVHIQACMCIHTHTTHAHTHMPNTHKRDISLEQNFIKTWDSPALGLCLLY